ncbi:MAG: class I SAM-dependent methyltransferase [Desulfosalsimonas sp.]|uniref:class I SAM-dependent methyltransferase n=1 Tax=Desulfosalsimonas sp. TaxID=3073848 RepID=UPI0039710948
MSETSEKRSFEQAAARWDEKPRRVQLAGDVAEAVKKQVPLNRDMDMLDFGCGTGLLTLALQPLVGSVTGVDSSPAMLEMLEKKIKEMAIDNVQTRLLDIDKGEQLSGRFDLVVSSMTLHHIPDIDHLIRQFCRVLKPGGHLALADLDKEGGRFHEDNHGVFHFGFNRQQLSARLNDAGFIDIRAETAAKLTKTEAGPPHESFSVFLISGVYSNGR